jgi:hypothetical protein
MTSWNRVAGIAVAISLLSASAALAALPIPAGETIHAVLSTQDINTKNAHVGDPFRMQLVQPYPGDHASLAGGVLHGHVLEVRSGGQGRKAQLKLGFDRLELPNGESSPIHATVEKLDKTPENTTARKALGAGAGAAVGSQTIGRLLGGALGSVVGLVGGAAGGYLYGNNDKPNFNVATGSQVTLVTTSRALLERRQSR